MVGLHFFHRVHTLTLIFLFLFIFWPTSSVFALEPTHHYTVIVNQVRGNECCSDGGVAELRAQIEAGQQNGVPLTFSVRYDALNTPQYITALQEAQNLGMEIGAFLEITPQLALDSGVEYSGSEANWYEAQHVYLVGYAPEDRIKIIDTYMARFKDAFSTYPSTTNSWIIDTPSLQYLKTEYGVTIHEITREQWGTDSYTMWGGPPHFPYFPSEKWAFIPAASPSARMPLIMRQTISDPVWNYGDTTNSHTSQPNDYRLADRGFDYFVHLFNQAHNQTSQPFTFALLGLENSMPEIDQNEFRKQLEYAGEWNKKSGNTALTASEFARIMNRTELTPITIHRGNDFTESSANQAWWITTPAYRARLRYSNTTLYLSDLRVYDPQIVDPYTTRIAEKLAYWVTPFILDGARFWETDPINAFHRPHTDQLAPRDEKFGVPTHITLARNISADDFELSPNTASNDWELRVESQVIARFAPDHFSITNEFKSATRPLKTLIDTWRWKDISGNFVWGFASTSQSTMLEWFPFIHSAGLEQEREERYPFIFPELKARPLDLNKTTTFVTNKFAQAGRNPIRLAFFPQDMYGYPTIITELPTITVDSESVNIELTQPSSQDGLVFIDLTSGEVQQTIVTITYQDYTSTDTVIFAPNCKTNARLCFQKPHYWWWYLRNWSDDKFRQWQENKAQR